MIFTTRANDRWDLIASDLWQLPELGWAIAEANPLISGQLVLDSGLVVQIPALTTLRRPLTAANPAREDDGEFQQLPPQAPSQIVPPSGGGGSVVFPITVAQGGTGGVTAQEALQNLGAVALASVGAVGGIAGLDGIGKVSVANLPPFQVPLSFPITVAQGGTGGTTAATARANIGAIALSDVPASIPPSAIGTTVAPLTSGVVPTGNLPPFQTPLTFPITVAQGGTGGATASAALANLGALAANTRGVASGVASLDTNTLIPIAQIPSITTAKLPVGVASGVAPLDTNSLVPINNIPLNTFFPFTNGVSFRGGTAPANASTSLIQSTVIGGIPTEYYVNSAAPANSRIRALSVANNGNLQFSQVDDALTTATPILEVTSSGNLILNGTGAIRSGTGSAAPTAASNVPGAIVFRTDLRADPPASSATGALTWSDGTNWRRLDGSLATTANNAIGAKFRAATNANQSIAATTTTKVNLATEALDTNNQYTPASSRLTAIQTEAWRVSLYITFTISVASTRIILWVYKNGVDIAGTSRVLDQVYPIGTSAVLITIPEFPLIANDYLEVFCFGSQACAVYGDPSLNATYWYGTRIN